MLFPCSRGRPCVELQRKKVEEMASLEMAECTFHPETYNADEVLIRLRPSMLGETEAERFARLSYDDSERVNRARDTVRDKYYSQFSYRPEINDQSKVRGMDLM